ncbi:MAG: hypothetical protein ACYC1M_08640 [Armatimonadota bacterium]
MSTTIISPSTRPMRSKSVSESRTKQHRGLNTCSKVIISANVFLALLWLFIASSGPGNLNRMSTEQSRFTAENNRLTYANQQLKSDILTETSDDVIERWAALHNFEKETAPEASAALSRNQASAASR